MLRKPGLSLAVLGSFLLTGTDFALAQGVADDPEALTGVPIEAEMLSPFSAMKLKDPDARWIVTIAVASDLAVIKAGDIVDFFVFPDRDGAPGQPRPPARPEPEPPTGAQILRSLSSGDGTLLAAEVTRENVRIVVERVDRLDEPRFFPMIGKAQLHKQHFKCTVYSRKTTRSDWPIPFERAEKTREIVYLDRDRLRDPADAKDVAEGVQVVGVTATRDEKGNAERLIVAVTPRQAVRLKSAQSSGIVYIRPHVPRE